MNATSTLIRPQTVLLECIVPIDPATGKSSGPIYFGMDVVRYMLNRKVIAIEFFCFSDMAASPNYPGTPIISATDLLKVSLTLLREPGNGIQGGDWYKNMPVSWLRRQINPGVAVPTGMDLFRMDPIEIAWGDSFLSIPTAIQTALPPPSKAISVPFQVTYLLPEQMAAPFITVKLKGHA